MNARRVLSIILLALTLLAPVAAEADRIRSRTMSDYSSGSGNMRWDRGRYSRWGGGYRHHDRVIVVPVERADPNIEVVHEPGALDYVIVKPLGFAWGLLFGKTKVIDTSCPDDDVACHAAKGREEGRYDGKSKVADATESGEYREAYDEAIRNSGRITTPTDSQPVEGGDTLLPAE